VSGVRCHDSTQRRGPGPNGSEFRHVLNDDAREAKAEVQGADVASPALQKLQGKVQGRPNLKLVG
jgi:hypothetical protein